MGDREQTPIPTRARRWRWIPVLVLLGAALALAATGALDALDLDRLADSRETIRAFVAASPVRAMALYVLAYVLAVSLSLPGAWWFSVTGGFVFGWLVGGALAVLSASAGAVVIFLAARTSFGDLVSRRFGPRLETMKAGFQRDALFYMLFLRLVPLVPFWLVNIAPALVGVPLRVYAGATVVGIVPTTFAFASAGEGLDSVIAAHRSAREECLARGEGNCAMSLSATDLVTPEILAALAAVGVVSLLPVVLRRLFGRRLRSLDGAAGTP